MGYFKLAFPHPSLFSECEGMEMFWPDQWCSIETLSKKTSQLLYHLELFKWVQQPSSYDNSSWGGHFFEDSWSHCVPQQRKSHGRIQPPPAHIAPRRTNHTISKISSPQPPQSCDSLFVHLSPPLCRPEKETKTHGPTAREIEK